MKEFRRIVRNDAEEIFKNNVEERENLITNYQITTLEVGHINTSPNSPSHTPEPSP